MPDKDPMRANTESWGSKLVATDVLQIPMPQPITPIAIIEAVTETQSQLQLQEPAGCEFSGRTKGSRVPQNPNLIPFQTN